MAGPKTNAAVSKAAVEIIARLEDEKAALQKALRPFSNCVFYDNGDATVSTGDLDLYTACVNAYFAMRKTT